jgi:putative hydroxymethylpyrimidine transport system substrate-binding protein
MNYLRRGTVLLCIASLLVLGCASASTANTAKPSNTGPQISSARCAANRAAGTITFLSAFGYDASAGILDVYAATQLGYFRQLCLSVTFNPNLSFAPVYPEVSAGVATITGEGSAADDLVAVGNGAAFTAVSTFGETSDYALLTRSSITSLRQLDGKTLGYHTQLPVVLTEMLQKAGVDVSKVHEVNDISFDPTLLVHGPYTALQAYQSNEPLTLDADGYAKDFTEWRPAQFAVSGTFNVQVVNTKFLEKHRDAVQDFLRAELHAFDYCVANATRCIDLTAKAAGKTFDVAHELAEWQLESALAIHHSVPGRGVGVETTSEWTPEATAVMQDKLVRKPVDLVTAENTSIAASLYHGSKLIWPGP